MANVIRFGKTPIWGTLRDSTNALIIDSVSLNVNVKDYEQLDEKGAVTGYLIYDQTIDFDLSGTMIAPAGFPENYNDTVSNTKWANPMKVGQNSLPIGVATTLMNVNAYNGQINEPIMPIIKSNSFSTTQGGAASFSASGTVYAFSATATTDELNEGL